MTGPGGAPFGPCPGATPEGSPCPRADWEEVRTWESGGPTERMPVFVGILRFFSNRQDWLTRSHVRRPPCAHMGARQLFLTDVRKPRNHAKNRPLCRQSPSLPCATPSPSPSERPARPPFRRDRSYSASRSVRGAGLAPAGRRCAPDSDRPRALSVPRLIRVYDP